MGKDEVRNNEAGGWKYVQEGQRRCLMWIDARLGGVEGLAWSRRCFAVSVTLFG